MKKIMMMLLVFALAAALCACAAAPEPEQPAAEPAKEAAAEPSPEPAVEATSEPTPESTSEPTAEPSPEPAAKTVHPYAWIGYEALPRCAYFDEISSQVFSREYDSYALGYVSRAVEASDGVNVYSFDDQSGILSLILNGETYNFNNSSMIYVYRDMTDVYPATLEQRAQRMEQGIDTSGKEFKGTGSEQIPLYCDKGDTASYEYYEFFTDGQYPMTERIYMKDGDVFAIYTRIETGADQASEITQVITAHSASPDPALFQLPDNFDEYTLYE